MHYWKCHLLETGCCRINFHQLGTSINSVHHFMVQNFGDTLYKHSLVFFTRPLIYSICISVLLFPYFEHRFSDLILLVYGFCSIHHEWIWLAYVKCSPINLVLLHSILDLLKMHFIVELWSC